MHFLYFISASSSHVQSIGTFHHHAGFLEGSMWASGEEMHADCEGLTFKRVVKGFGSPGSCNSSFIQLQLSHTTPCFCLRVPAATITEAHASAASPLPNLAGQQATSILSDFTKM
eukprot:1152620-Pelagomonas_calceolata.AAC.3